MFVARLADKMVLRSTTGPIDAGDRIIHKVPAGDEVLEMFECFRHDAETASGLVALKFPGTGGRAERAGPHPLELMPPEVSAVVYSVNPSGYGGSSGRATLQTLARQCESVLAYVRNCHPEWPILLVGNSLGCMSALYLAARHEVAGVCLRNPPPLAQLIRERRKYNWWNFGMARHIASVIPPELDSIANAGRCQAPALFQQSELDAVVPVEYQNRIIDAYGGSKKKFVIRGADHGSLVPQEYQDEYLVVVKEFLGGLL